MIAQAGIFGLGPWELVIILAIILVLFGGGKLAGLGKASGKAIREFKEEISGTAPTTSDDVTADTATPKPEA